MSVGGHGDTHFGSPFTNPMLTVAMDAFAVVSAAADKRRGRIARRAGRYVGRVMAAATAQSQPTSIRIVTNFDGLEGQTASTATSMNVLEFKPTEFEVPVIKNLLFLQLSSDPSGPAAYALEDDSQVVEFYEHPSHLVCVIDEDGVQLMWNENNEPKSAFVPDEYLSFRQISQKIAGVLRVR
jgi:hypothetical protein